MRFAATIASPWVAIPAQRRRVIALASPHPLPRLGENIELRFLMRERIGCPECIWHEHQMTLLKGKA